MSRALHGLRQRWSERRHYRGWHDFLFAIYNRVLLRSRALPLPFRGRVYGFRLVGVERPLAVRLGTTDAHVMEEIFFHGEYDPLLKRHPKQVEQVVDLGANVGLSLRQWRRSLPNARVLAVEPDERNMSVCRFNAELGGDTSKCSFVQACISATPGMVRLDRSGGEWGLRMSRAAGDDSANDQPVKAITMMQLLGEQGIDRIDLLKCDIEGAEAEVFSNCSDWISHVRHLVVELHHPYDRRQFEADLERNGGQFSVYHSTIEGSHEVLFLERKTL